MIEACLFMLVILTALRPGPDDYPVIRCRPPVMPIRQGRRCPPSVAPKQFTERQRIRLRRASGVMYAIAAALIVLALAVWLA